MFNDCHHTVIAIQFISFSLDMIIWLLCHTIIDKLNSFQFYSFVKFDAKSIFPSKLFIKFAIVYGGGCCCCYWIHRITCMPIEILLKPDRFIFVRKSILIHCCGYYSDPCSTFHGDKIVQPPTNECFVDFSIINVLQ